MKFNFLYFVHLIFLEILSKAKQFIISKKIFLRKEANEGEHFILFKNNKKISKSTLVKTKK